MESGQRRNADVSAHEIQISNSLFVVVFALMLCWVPAWVITIMTRFVGKVPCNVQLLCAFFVNLSNTVNPFIYAGMNSLLRREFKGILHCFFFSTEFAMNQARKAKTIKRDLVKEPFPLLKAPHRAHCVNCNALG